MVFKGRDLVRSKIIINNNVIELINIFHDLGCFISYQNEKHITVKISTFLQIMRIINRTLKPSQVQIHTRLKIYNVLTLPTLLYGCKTWAIIEQDKCRITSAEMEFMGRTAKYTWQDYKTNKDILSEFKIDPVVKKIQN